MKKIVKKWEGGAKKHGGIGKAMGVQIDKWIQRDEEQAKEAKGGGGVKATVGTREISQGSGGKR